MSEILLESDFLTVDLRSLYTNKATDENDASSDAGKKQTKSNSIKNELIAHGIPESVIEKLMLLGEPFKKALMVLGFRNDDPKAKNNPILAFVKQDYVQKNLISTGLLNANTFKAIYNAVAKKLVADSEFFKVNSYNIIYCKNLYKKSTKEIEEYLKEQSKILTVDASSYSSDVQTANKKAFIYIEGIYRDGTTEDELEPSKRAKLINKPDTVAKSVTDTNAKLNSISLVRLISGRSSQQAEFGTKEQNNIINNIKQFGIKLESAVFAMLLALSLNTNSKKVRSAMADPVFSSKNDVDVIKAMNKISAGGVLPKNGISDTDADSLADVLLAAVKANN